MKMRCNKYVYLKDFWLVKEFKFMNFEKLNDF